MIIELTGIPGSGKSTVIESLKKLQETKGYIFDIQSYILGRSLLPLRGKVAYEIVLFTHIFLLKRMDWSLFKNIFLIVKNSGNTLFHKINILRNTLKKLIIYRYIKDRDEIFFIDEGVSHIPFTIFVDVSKKIKSSEVRVLLERIPSVDALLIIDAHDDVLLKRVLERGHRRINFKSKKDVECFMQQSREVLGLVKNYFTGCVYQNIEKTVDTQKIMNELGFENV